MAKTVSGRIPAGLRWSSESNHPTSTAAFRGHDLALGTRAPVRTNRVLTDATHAQTGDRTTFVHVCKHVTSSHCGKTAAKRQTFALLLPRVQHEASFARVGKFRAFLARISPGSTNRRAAQVLRARDAR